MKVVRWRCRGGVYVGLWWYCSLLIWCLYILCAHISLSAAHTERTGITVADVHSMTGILKLVIFESFVINFRLIVALLCCFLTVCTAYVIHPALFYMTNTIQQ